MKMESLERLRELKKIHSQNEIILSQMRSRFESLANRHSEGTTPKAIASFNLFQTPEIIAQKMAQMIEDHCKDIGCPYVLEPSAGLGRLYKPARLLMPQSKFWMIDTSKECCEELRKVADDCDRILCRDFEETAPEELPSFDAVLMNPPFKMGTDIRHIKHAIEFLKTGGLIVSLCYDGSRQNEKLKPLCNSWEKLPSGTFKSEGTGADVIMLTIIKE